MCVNIALLLGAFLFADDRSAGQNDEIAAFITPDAGIQADILQAMAPPKEDSVEGRHTAQCRAAELLDRAKEQHREKLVQQLLYWYLSEDNRQFPATAIILRVGFSRYDIAKAVTPYLGTSYEPLKQEVTKLLTYVEDGQGRDGPDFSQYKQLITRSKDDPPQSLIEYMFEEVSASFVL